MPLQFGCSGRTAHRRLRAWEEAGVWDRIHADLLRMLRDAGKLDLDLVVTPGCHWRSGRPRPTRATTQIIPLVLQFPKVGGKPGRPKEHPEVLVADRGSDSDSTRWLLRWMGIKPRIGKRRTPHGSGLGKVRWVVERTISWVKGFRRMRVRYDRLGVIRDAWATLAACGVCFRILMNDNMSFQGFCQGLNIAP